MLEFSQSSSHGPNRDANRLWTLSKPKIVGVNQDWNCPRTSSVGKGLGSERFGDAQQFQRNVGIFAAFLPKIAGVHWDWNSLKTSSVGEWIDSIGRGSEKFKIFMMIE